MTRRTTRSPAPADVTLPKPAELDRLKLSPEVAYYLLSRGIPLPGCPPIVKTPEPRELPGARFDPDRVDRVLRSLSMLRHTQGEWAGRPLRPDPWQVAYVIAPVFGWVHREHGRWVRIIRSLYLDVPRKNGKTTLSGGLAMYLTAADGEAGGQVYALAAAKDQARYCFDPVKAIAQKSPQLAPHVKPLADKIVHPASGSYFAVASSLGDLIHGANIHAAIVDELHVHKTRDLVDAVETGTAARAQPLIATISTADDGRPGTIYAEKRSYVESLAARTITDPTVYGVIFAAARSQDELAELGLTPFDEETWRRANPGYGISPTQAFMRAEAASARQSPAKLARFLRLHCGIRTKQETRYIRLADWDDTAGLIDETKLAGRTCRGGLDLASVEDLTAFALLFPGEDGGMDVLWRHWLPEDRLPDLDKRTAGQASVWVREGFLELTPGNVIDNDRVLARILADAARFRIETLGFDRWGASDLVRRLGDEGVTCVGVGQGYASMAAPMKELLRLILARTLRHGGNPLVRWQVDHLAVDMDAAGNAKPAKNRSADKIDGISAVCDALKEHLDAAAEPAPQPQIRTIGG